MTVRNRGVIYIICYICYLFNVCACACVYVCVYIVEILCLSASRVMIIRLPLDNREINVNCVMKRSS